MANNKAIEAFAEHLEAYFASESIALTMGGEPTFIPAQPDAAEWNTAAMGEENSAMHVAWQPV